MPLSINTKEMLAIWYSLCSFNQFLAGKSILIQSDNTTAVSYMSKMGGMQSELCDKIVIDIWNFAISMGSWLHISHLPDCLNSKADLASRVLNDETEWKLDSDVFRTICTLHSFAPTIDLFASCLNTKLKKFISFVLDPNCFHVDAFTLTWSEISYIFPPFILLNRVLLKLSETILQQTPLLPPPHLTSMEPGPAQPKLQLNEAYFHYVIQQCFSTQDLSQQAASDFIKSFAKGTMSGYGGIYKEWLHFAHQNHFNPL